MPSLSRLASTIDQRQHDTYQFETDNNNVDFDIGGEEVDVDNIGTNVDSVNTIELNPFRRHAPVPPGLAYQIHLQNVLGGHRTNDLNIAQEVNECVQLHAGRGVDLAHTKIYSRTELISTLTEVYNLKGMRPTLNRVKLCDNSEAVVPTFDIKTMLLSLLNDPSRMRPENMASNYNPFTGKPIDDTYTNVDEIHTGSAWEQARAHYCGDDSSVFPCALLAFYDKTHSDVFGSLACAPFIVASGLISWVRQYVLLFGCTSLRVILLDIMI